jgi:hypothetical protein
LPPSLPTPDSPHLVDPEQPNCHPEQDLCQRGFSPDFPVVAGVEYLYALNIDSNGSHYYQNALAEFCDDGVAHMARSATALTALSIRSGQRADVRPVLAFKDILHPHLMSLALTSSGWILVFQTRT